MPCYYNHNFLEYLQIIITNITYTIFRSLPKNEKQMYNGILSDAYISLNVLSKIGPEMRPLC